MMAVQHFTNAADGDGGFTCIDPDNHKNMWHTYYNLSPEYSTTGGDSDSWQYLGEEIFKHPSEFYPPLTLNKSNSDDIAIGGQILYLDHLQNKQMFYDRLFNISGETYGLFRIVIHPPYDPDEALADQIELIKHLKEKESYRFVTYSDLLGLESSILTLMLMFILSGNVLFGLAMLGPFKIMCAFWSPNKFSRFATVSVLLRKGFWVVS